jgi:hypothetical protein
MTTTRLPVRLTPVPSVLRRQRTRSARRFTCSVSAALIFARTETVPFFRHVWECATALLFLRGRIDFNTVDGRLAAGNAGAPSVLCACGARDAEVLAFCGIDGQFVPLHVPRSVLVAGLDQAWLQAVTDWMRAQRGPIELAEIYRAFAAHRKAARNPNYQAKIRQVLPRGPFRRVARGQWSAA